MMFKIILWAIVIYVLYRFIIGFVLPVTKVASQMKNKVKEMQDLQRRQQEQYQQQQQPVKEKITPTAPASSGDYIDFEEVK
jgi:cell division protein FtsX